MTVLCLLLLMDDIEVFIFFVSVGELFLGVGEFLFDLGVVAD